MTAAATLDTRRRALGLSVQETADWLGVAQERTMRALLFGRSTIHDPGAWLSRLDELERIMEGVADGLVRAATDVTDAGPVVLERYLDQADLDDAMERITLGPPVGLPLGAHAMAIAWADQQLAAEGVDTVIRYA